MHAQDLTALAATLGVAAFTGLLLSRLRLGAVAAFILVGIVLGPSGFQLIENSTAIQTLADLGVVMLLFILGMELRLQAFRTHLALAIAVTLALIAVTAGLATLLARLTGGQTTGAIVIAFMLAISSTAVGIRMIQDADDAQSAAGKLAVAVLVAQDLAVIPLLLIIGALSPRTGSVDLALTAGKLFGESAVIIGFVVLLTRIKSFRFPASQYFLGDFDAGTLVVLGICFAAAALSGLLGTSPALGAFLAGLAVGHSTLRRSALTLAQPVQSILVFVFFLALGLLIDLDYVRAHVWLILAAFLVVTFGKTALNVGVLRLLRQPGHVAFPAALFLSPVGEFSFVLASAAVAAGTLTSEGYKFAVVLISLSLLASPFWFVGARRAHGLARGGVVDDLIKRTYARELSFLERLRSRSTNLSNPERVPPAAMESVGPDDDDDYLEPFVDIPRSSAKSPPAAPAFRRRPDPGG